jgi:cob(I)alamin adenosyltransferase
MNMNTRRLVVNFLGRIRSSGSLRNSFSNSSSSSTSSTVERGQIAVDSNAKKSTVYTRTGDSGTSSLYNGERRPKTDAVFDSLGHQDELNAVMGIAREYCERSGNGIGEMLAEIQSRLFDVGAAVATPVQTSTEEKRNYTKFPREFTRTIEIWLDELDSKLPPLTNFVIPSGGMTSLHLNLARTICRRAERAVVPLVQAEQVDAEVGRYLNRLSDFLFVAARTAASKEGKPELLWKKPNYINMK